MNDLDEAERLMSQREQMRFSNANSRLAAMAAKGVRVKAQIISRFVSIRLYSDIWVLMRVNVAVSVWIHLCFALECTHPWVVGRWGQYR